MRPLFLTLTLLTTITLTACGGTPQILNKSKDGSVNQVNLERHFQRMVTYGCNGQVLSDSIETVKSPVQSITVSPDDPSKVYEGKFRNKRNGATKTTGSSGTFTLDYSYGFFNMHVESGMNDIEYTFYACDSWSTSTSGSKTCNQAKTIVEEGTVSVNISYTEKRLSEVYERTECTPPTTTPKSK